MLSIIESLREIIGQPQFYNSQGVIDYGAVTEYFICGILVCIVTASIFKFLLNLTKQP